MKQCYLLLLLTFLCGSMYAQSAVNPGTRAKAAIQFTKLLNDAAIVYPPQLSYLTESGAKIESSFRISEDGILSVTFRYPVENSFSLYRVTAPVSAMKAVFCDYYLGLEFDGNVVKIEESDKGSRELKESNTLSLFHIAKPGDGPAGEKLKARVEQGLREFRTSY
ncbi:hypothetical protein ACTJJ0_27445 [Chitinophaga sp. 22321]|uniref:DUF4468 domain-containing protein n=1 Tax=Chitinophaga hostae TaxID=2831022 RepID=A0ABS5J6K2_9BACT|nr:hypothetical protein [Chitinophaga hostae]MBS0030849.1 hypothetical protein [Chitinophaga hostae]